MQAKQFGCRENYSANRASFELKNRRIIKTWKRDKGELLHYPDFRVSNPL